ncbi:MAG: hypothetical protein GH150_00495 [Hadesarchaea archaeon]|nr:hypothetical protein [Hadesarchaea archaeon]
MITSMTFAISTTSVSATHATPTISLSPDFVKVGESYVFTLSVRNNGGDPIDNVEIVDLGFASIKSMSKLPKDNIVSCENVTLADGTPVTVVADSVTVPENTELLVLEGENILFGEGFMVLLEDALVEVPDDTGTSLVAGAEVTVEEQKVEIDTDLRLLADTLIDNENILPEDTSVELVAENNVDVTGDLTLAADNEVSLTENDVRLVNNVTANYLGLEFTILAGETIYLTGDNSVVLLAGTVVENVSASVTVAENTDVTILGDTVVTPTGTPVPVPEGWTPSVNMWSGTEDNIKAGETVEFPFSAIAPTDGTYNITVKTTDVNGYEALVVITLTSDGEAPSVTATVSPELTNSSVTITVEASEKLSELGKVTVKQDNADDENVFEITMTSFNGITWTGTYAVIPDHEGTATVAIENSTDMVGNVGGENSSVATFDVDTIAPNAPTAVSAPSSNGEVILLDNFVNQPNQWVYGLTDEAKVLVRVNAKTITTIPRADNGYSVAITLAEGTNEIGVSLVDAAGNASDENVQEVVLDSLSPTVAVVSIAGKAYKANMPINDNTPKIVAKMLDAVSGVKRENSSVKLDDNDLENANVWDPETGLFENTVENELSEGTHTITVTALDKSGVNPATTENFTFVVDTIAPTMPSLEAGNNPILNGTTALDPMVQRDTTLVFYGSDLEASSTAKIYLIDQATGNGISTATTTADAAGNFSKSLTLPEGKVVRIEVGTVDAAGNVSSRSIYGYAMVDATAPSVTLAELSETTDKSSITISGTVSKDSWEDLSDITLTVQVGTGRVVVPIGAGGSYSYSLALSEGPNTIVVQATDYVGNASTAVSATVERTVTPWMTYAIVLVIVALLMAVIAIFRK